MAPPPSPARSRAALPRVAVIEAQPLFRDALCRVIRQRPQLQLAGEGGDARQALALLRNARPDVALIDPALPTLSGDRLLTLSSSEGLTTRFLFVAAHLGRTTAYELLVLGAAGCVLRDTTADELGRAIAEVADGRTFLCRAVQEARSARSASASASPARCSARASTRSCAGSPTARPRRRSAPACTCPPRR